MAGTMKCWTKSKYEGLTLISWPRREKMASPHPSDNSHFILLSIFGRLRCTFFVWSSSFHCQYLHCYLLFYTHEIHCSIQHASSLTVSVRVLYWVFSVQVVCVCICLCRKELHSQYNVHTTVLTCWWPLLQWWREICRVGGQVLCSGGFWCRENRARPQPHFSHLSQKQVGHSVSCTRCTTQWRHVVPLDVHRRALMFTHLECSSFNICFGITMKLVLCAVHQMLSYTTPILNGRQTSEDIWHPSTIKVCHIIPSALNLFSLLSALVRRSVLLAH